MQDLSGTISESAPAPGAGSSAFVAVTATGDARIDGLLEGSKWLGPITYSNPDSPDDYPANYVSDLNANGTSAQNEGFSQLNAAQMKALHSALTNTLYTQESAASTAFSVSGFTNLDIGFAGPGDGTATIRVANSDDWATAYARFPDDSSGNGDSFFGNSYDGTPSSFKTPVNGGYAWFTFLHEMGHALGLKHSFQFSSSIKVTVPYEFDYFEYTVMSYNSYQYASFGPISAGQWGFPQTYMMFDIAALQTLYGADYTVNSGDTTYKWSPTSGKTLIDGQTALAPGDNVIFATIWDGGGTDTYDLSAYSNDLRIDLSPGGYSVFGEAQKADLGDFHDASGNIYNALTFGGSNASLIENAIGGSGKDTITGNDAANTLTGGEGNDLLDGGAGNDTLDGGPGTDTASYLDFTSGVTVDLSIVGPQDTRSAGSDTLISIENINGSDYADTLRGDANANAIDGRKGADTMAGGPGDDTYRVDSTLDKVLESVGQGTDRIISSVDYSLAGTFVETLELTGFESLNATGNSQANTLIGNVGPNRLDGKGGADTMAGGISDDVYVVDNKGDKVIEEARHGVDTILSSVSYGLAGTFVETLQLTGTEAIDATGNAQANTLIGNAAANRLDGSGGNDRMSGGPGDDTYVVDNKFDMVVELRGEGTDTVLSSVSYNLAGTFVEILQLTGTGAINATGNGQLNTLIGNAGDNVLDGGQANDTLTGGAGADTFRFSTAPAGGVDTITDFVSGVDRIVLAANAFAGLAAGALNAAFQLGTAADDPGDRVIYDGATGRLWVDPDGAGSLAQYLFAKLAPGTALAATDILVA